MGEGQYLTPFRLPGKFSDTGAQEIFTNKYQCQVSFLLFQMSLLRENAVWLPELPRLEDRCPCLHDIFLPFLSQAPSFPGSFFSPCLVRAGTSPADWEMIEWSSREKALEHLSGQRQTGEPAEAGGLISGRRRKATTETPLLKLSKHYRHLGGSPFPTFSTWHHWGFTQNFSHVRTLSLFLSRGKDSQRRQSLVNRSSSLG